MHENFLDSEATGLLHSIVFAAIVGENDFIDYIKRYLVVGLLQCFFGIVGRHHHDDFLVSYHTKQYFTKQSYINIPILAINYIYYKIGDSFFYVMQNIKQKYRHKKSARKRNIFRKETFVETFFLYFCNEYERGDGT